jgi:hypothetical protein
MIIKLIVDQEYKGVKYKKGATVVCSRSEAKHLCLEGLGVTETVFPCEERQKKAAKKKSKKKKTEEDSDTIDNKL